MTVPCQPWPEDALVLLQDRTLVEWACDLGSNPRHHHADQRTRGPDGLRLVDLYRKHTREQLADGVGRLLRLPTPHFRRALGPLLRHSLPKRRYPVELDARGEEPTGNLDVVPYLDDPSGGARRPIVLMSVWRRLVSAHVAEVLGRTSETILPTVASAYRPGRRDVIPTILGKVKKAISEGYIYYSDPDFEAFFETVRWDVLRRTLLEQGYPATFVDLVMVLVEAPYVSRGGRGSCRGEHRMRGLPQGTPEAPLLANLLLKPIDDEIVARFGRGRGNIFYDRYSDNAIFLGKTREDVERAFSCFRRRSAEAGLVIKDSTYSGKPKSTSSLVHSLRRRPLVHLGVEIALRGRDHDPTLRMPAKTFDALLRRLSHMLRFSAGAMVAGVSQYSTVPAQAGRAGRRRFDEDDVARCLEQVGSFWGPLLGQSAMERLVADLSTRLKISLSPFLAGSSREPTIWIAHLGCTEVRGSEAHRDQDVYERSTVGALPNPGRIEALYRGGSSLGRPKDEAEVGQGKQEEGEGQEPLWLPLGPVSGGRGGPTSAPQEASHSGRASRGRDSGPSEEASFPGRSAGHFSDRFSRRSLGGALESAEGYDLAVQEGAQASSPPDFAHRQDVWVDVRHSRREGRGVLGVERSGIPLVGLPSVDRVVLYSFEGEYASRLMRAIEAEVELASRSGARILAVHLAGAAAWVAKGFIQRTRAFRSPPLFARVLHLHEAAERSGMAVLLAGPVLPPLSLENQVRSLFTVRMSGTSAR